MENYFNYFTEIEEHYLRRRGTHLLLSTLDWALIETWKSAGVPLEAVLRGVDDAFDKYDRRPSKSKKVNSLAYCSQAVLAAAEDMKEAAVGAASSEKAQREPGFEAAQIAALEEKLFAVLMAATPDDDLVKVRAEADRDLAPYRRNMTASQVEQLHKQYVHKRLLERCGVPRLSLFYMH